MCLITVTEFEKIFRGFVACQWKLILSANGPSSLCRVSYFVAKAWAKWRGRQSEFSSGPRCKMCTKLLLEKIHVFWIWLRVFSSCCDVIYRRPITSDGGESHELGEEVVGNELLNGKILRIHSRTWELF